MRAEARLTCDLLARLCEYPGEDVVAAAIALRESCPPGSGRRELAADFLAFVSGLDPHELEEAYVRTFDLSAPVCLDVGYQLFGESYKRGAFLVTMRGAARRHGLDGTIELPDHLSVVLRVLPRLAEDEKPRDLVVDAVLPALHRMRAGFGKTRGGYSGLLALIDEFLRAEHEVNRTETGPLPFSLPVVAEGGAL